MGFYSTAKMARNASICVEILEVLCNNEWNITSVGCWFSWRATPSLMGCQQQKQPRWGGGNFESGEWITTKKAPFLQPKAYINMSAILPYKSDLKTHSLYFSVNFATSLILKDMMTVTLVALCHLFGCLSVTYKNWIYSKLWHNRLQ